MEKSDFDRLMERYLRNQVSEEERVKIEAWLEVMKTKDTTTLELSEQEEDKLFQKITSKTSSVEDVVALAPAIPKRATLIPWTLRIAAALIIALGLAYFAWRIAFDHGSRMEVVSNAKEHKKAILNDGSLVWLRGEGSFNFSGNTNEGIRYGELQGEALFEIAKDADHPFIIECAGVRVKVLGTSFSIKTGKDQIELAVLTGNVNLSSDSNVEGINVGAMERVIFNAKGEIAQLTMDARTVTSVIDNTEYDMKFTNTAMNDVLKKIENKFNANIHLTNSKIGQCRITADFTDHSLTSTLELIADILGIEYSQDGNTISINGEGC